MTPSLYDPVADACDRRNDRLVDVAEASGEWVTVAASRTPLAELEAWRRHCEATRWQAFQLGVEGVCVVCRFVGTRIGRTTLKTGRSWTGVLMQRPASPAKVREWA